MLGMWTGVENMLTWVIAAHITGNSPSQFGLFMKYSADRIPAQERIQMLGEIMRELKVVGEVEQDRVLRGLHAINNVRVKVAHATAIRMPETGETTYVKVKKGLPELISPADLGAQVDAAAQELPGILVAIAQLAAATGVDLAANWSPPLEDPPEQGPRGVPEQS